MSEEYRMTKEERKTVELAIQNLHEAVAKLNDAYKCVYELTFTYGWDCDCERISAASMVVGLEALDIIDSIANIDGWEYHKSKQETKS